MPYGGRSAPFSLKGQGSSVERRLDAPVPIGPIQPRAVGLDSGQGLRRRMTVRVHCPHRNDRGPGVHAVEVRVGRRGATAVMGDLQEVDPGQAPGEQDRFDLLLDISGQQEALGPERSEQRWPGGSEPQVG